MRLTGNQWPHKGAAEGDTFGGWVGDTTTGQDCKILVVSKILRT